MICMLVIRVAISCRFVENGVCENPEPLFVSALLLRLQFAGKRLAEASEARRRCSRRGWCSLLSFQPHTSKEESAGPGAIRSLLSVMLLRRAAFLPTGRTLTLLSATQRFSLSSRIYLHGLGAD